MKRPAYRVEDEKYLQLKHKLLENGLSYQEFADWCVTQYLAGKINPKEERE